LLGQQKGKRRLESSIIGFFKRDRNERRAEAFNEDCLDLCNRLGQSDAGNADSLPDSANHLDQHDRSAEFSNDVFQALELYSQCKPGLHETERQGSGDLWHPMRLCLSEHDREAAYFDVFVASSKMTVWQELRLEM
jgi:hypothetical protein